MTDSVPAVGPLHGVRVLDLTSVIMGPYATQILGDLGAEVISIEDPKADANRTMGPGPAPGMSGVSLNLLRNKRNVSLDLKQPQGREAFLRIAATCDVMVTNLRPGPLGRLGLTYEVVWQVRPDIVMCQAQGWPSDSDYADKPAYDDVVQAGCGIADAFALQTGTPALAPTIVADKVSGLTIVYAVLAALLHRATTGEGQCIEVPMIDVLTSFTLVEHGSAAIPEPALGPAGYGRILAPDRRPYATLDGWLAVLPYSASNFDDLYREGGRSDLVGDPRALTAVSRNRHAPELYAELGPVIATRTTGFWVRFCDEHDIPASAVRTLDEVVGELPVVQHPVFGAFREVPPPVRFSATPSSVRRPAPRLGEHGREVLYEVGLSFDEVAGLERNGVLRHATAEE